MRFRSAHLLRVALTISALALTLTGCAAAPAKGGATATHTLPAPLAWKQVTLPPGFNPSYSYISVSPVDGHIAWTCEPVGASTWAIWKTTDTGATWKQTGQFSYTAPMSVATCGLVADQQGTSALQATVTWGSGEAGTLSSASFYSADGATHWAHLPSGMEFATAPNGAIGLVSMNASQAGATQEIIVSSNGFQTWRSMTPQGLPTSFFNLAIAPGGSTLIGSGYNNTLWRSTDLGAHWTQLPGPGSQTSLVAWMPQREVFLMCCGDTGHPLQFKCSTDFGAHWTPINLPTYIYNCDFKCGSSTGKSTMGCPPIGMTADGSLIAECNSGEVTVSANPVVAPPQDVYLLRLGATTWQDLGVVPGAINMAPATGPTWCATATPDQLTGYDTAQLPV